MGDLSALGGNGNRPHYIQGGVDPNDQGDGVANPNDPSGKSAASGLGAASEALGFSSAYRSPGYTMNKNAGYVGGDYGASQAELARYGAQADASRAGIGQFQGQYGQGVGLQNQARMDQRGGLAMTADAANMYRQMAMGQGPSLAQQQLQQGLQQAQAQQASMAAGARGGGANLAAAQMAASSQMGQQSAMANQQAAQIRAQEQIAAMQGYGGLAGQYGQQAGAMRGQDLGYAGMAQSGMGMQQQEALAYERMRQGQQLAELGAQSGLEQGQGQLATTTQGQISEQTGGSAKGGGGLFGGILGGLAGVMSDVRAKKNIAYGGADALGAVDKLKAYTYDYKDPRMGQGRQIGVMAQDLERSPAGARAVIETPQGKAINGPAALGLSLASIAALKDKVDALEAEQSGGWAGAKKAYDSRAVMGPGQEQRAAREDLWGYRK